MQRVSDEKIEILNLLKLSDWVGEIFRESPTSTSGILDDRDEELLGSSLSEKQRISSITINRKSIIDSKAIALNDLRPEKLLLTSNDSPVMVECMLVEVKSHSDKLDDRQE